MECYMATLYVYGGILQVVDDQGNTRFAFYQNHYAEVAISSSANAVSSIAAALALGKKGESVCSPLPLVWCRLGKNVR